MTPAEIRQANLDAERTIGAEATVSISINQHGEFFLYAGVWPNGMVNDFAFSVGANDWTALFDTLRSKWAEFAEEHRRRLVDKMALEIIRITADQGACSDAALRAAKFAPADIEMVGAEACHRADEIASNGPFEITLIEGANAA